MKIQSGDNELNSIAKEVRPNVLFDPVQLLRDYSKNQPKRIESTSDLPDIEIGGDQFLVAVGRSLRRSEQPKPGGYKSTEYDQNTEYSIEKTPNGMKITDANKTTINVSLDLGNGPEASPTNKVMEATITNKSNQSLAKLEQVKKLGAEGGVVSEKKTLSYADANGTEHKQEVADAKLDDKGDLIITLKDGGTIEWHSDGSTFERDKENRITRLSDANGSTYEYSYDYDKDGFIRGGVTDLADINDFIKRHPTKITIQGPAARGKKIELKPETFADQIFDQVFSPLAGLSSSKYKVYEDDVAKSSNLSLGAGVGASVGPAGAGVGVSAPLQSLVNAELDPQSGVLTIGFDSDTIQGKLSAESFEYRLRPDSTATTTSFSRGWTGRNKTQVDHVRSGKTAGAAGSPAK